MNQCVTQYKEDNAYKLWKAHIKSNKVGTDQKVVRCLDVQTLTTYPFHNKGDGDRVRL